LTPSKSSGSKTYIILESKDIGEGLNSNNSMANPSIKALNVSKTLRGNLGRAHEANARAAKAQKKA